MTKEYLKMADVFTLPVKDEDRKSAVELFSRMVSAPYSVEYTVSLSQYAAHAINSHDELVAEVERLNVLLECSKEVIRFCNEDLVDDDAATFMRIWSNADWDALRETYPEANEIVYAADPTWRGWGWK